MGSGSRGRRERTGEAEERRQATKSSQDAVAVGRENVHGGNRNEPGHGSVGRGLVTTPIVRRTLAKRRSSPVAMTSVVAGDFASP